MKKSKRPAKPGDKARSDRWPTFRRKFLKGKVCAACGGTKKLEAHHIRPFHKHPEDELKVSNLMPLCEGNKDIECHLVVGHSFDFKGWNVNARADARALLKKKISNKRRVRAGSKK
jgi:5-methylcytosine-specific restriction enzyme A